MILFLILSLSLGDTVRLPVGVDPQLIINQNPPGTIYQFDSGYYKLCTIKPKSHDQYIGKTGPGGALQTLLSGAVTINVWQKKNTFWISDVSIFKRHSSGWRWKKWGQVHGFCEEGYEACKFPEDLFVDDHHWCR